MKKLFYDFFYQLIDQGHKVQKGQIVDANFVDVTRQRNNKEENKQIKEGKVPGRLSRN